MNSEKWIIYNYSRDVPPVEVDQVLNLIYEGEIRPDTLVKSTKSEEWVPAGEIEIFRRLFYEKLINISNQKEYFWKNENQKTAVLIGTGILFIVLLFPPFVQVSPPLISIGSDQGYHFIFNPPYGSAIDWSRLIVQILAVVLLTAIGFLLLAKEISGDS